MGQSDYYKVLGVEQNATPQQIKEAYRQLAFRYHPDRNNENPAGAEKMKSINEAYAVLSDTRKRTEYDHLRRQYGSSAYNQFRQQYSEQDIFRGSDIQRIFEEMARSFGFRGSDEIFREFYGQGFRSYRFQNRGASGRGFIFSARFGKPDAAHPPFQLGNMGRVSRYLLKKLTGMQLPEKGNDMNDVLTISPELARSGGRARYHNRRNAKELMVRIPPGIRDGQKIRLSGMGDPGRDGGDDGDLYLKVQIKKPFLQKLKEMF